MNRLRLGRFIFFAPPVRRLMEGKKQGEINEKIPFLSDFLRNQKGYKSLTVSGLLLMKGAFLPIFIG